MEKKDIKKRFLSLILAIISALTVFSFTACGGDNSIIIFAAAEEERIAFLQTELDEQFPDYEIIIQSVGTGEFFTKLQGEKQNIDCDIFFDLEVSNAERLIAEVPNLFYDLSSYDYSKYVANTKDFTDRHHYYAIDCKMDLAFIVNKTVLGNKPIPATYNDLLDPMYKDLIVMPDPKTSGTGYSFLSGMVAMVGEINALNYFASLDNNVKEYTTSGSAPMKSVNRGDAGIGVCMLWQGVNYKNANSNLEVVILDDITPYALYGMGVVNTHETKTGVLEVFEYLYNEANQKCVEEFNTGNLYVGQAPSTTPNFPANVNEIDLSAVIYDYNYKTSLIDKWTF